MFLLLFLALLVLPITVAIILTKISYYVVGLLVNNFGTKSQFITSGGTLLHELSHYLAGKLFGFEILHVNLCNFRHWQEDDEMGYVIMRKCHRNNFYKRSGYFVIGIAPCVVSMIISWIGQSRFSTDALNYGNTIYNIIPSALSDLGELSPFHLSFWVSAFIVFEFFMVCCELSDEDWHMTKDGVVWWIRYLIIAYLILISFNANLFNLIALYMRNIATMWLVFLIQMIIYLIVIVIILKIIIWCKNRIS